MSIIELAHEQVGVCISDREQAGGVRNGQLHPVSQVLQHHMAHLAPGKPFHICQCQGGEKGTVGKAVRQTPSKGNFRSIVSKPVDKVFCKTGAALLELLPRSVVSVTDKVAQSRE